jgi:hypothetical protein
MKPATNPRDLHTLAARNHEEAAQLHRDAAQCHDQNRVMAAQTSATSAMECCNRAQTHSAAACESSAHHAAMAQEGVSQTEGHANDTHRPLNGTLRLKPR